MARWSPRALDDDAPYPNHPLITRLDPLIDLEPVPLPPPLRRSVLTFAWKVVCARLSHVRGTMFNPTPIRDPLSLDPLNQRFTRS